MASIVSICNKALSHIGKPSIQSIDEDSAEAAACKIHYDETRDILLSWPSHDWTFSKTPRSLAAITNVRSDSWDYAYKRPVDCMKILAIDETLSKINGVLAVEAMSAGALRYGVPYMIEGTTIFTNVSPAWLAFIRRVEDAAEFPVWFSLAFSWHLAAALAMPLTRSEKVRDTAMRGAQMYTNQAIAWDRSNQVTITPQVSSFEEARD